MPGRVVGIVVSTALKRGISSPRALWMDVRRMGPWFFAIVTAQSVGVRATWRLRRMLGSRKLPPALRVIARQQAIPVVSTGDINTRDTVAALHAMRPDLLVSIYFNQRIGREVLAVAPAGAINLHPALLPKHRGPWPNFWVLASGENRTGLTVHWIDEGIDTGALLLQRELEVPLDAGVSTLMGMVARPGAAALIEALRLIEAGRAPRHPQDASLATYDRFPRHRDYLRLRRRGGRYGTGAELVKACERRD